MYFISSFDRKMFHITSAAGQSQKRVKPILLSLSMNLQTTMGSMMTDLASDGHFITATKNTNKESENSLIEEHFTLEWSKVPSHMFKLINHINLENPEIYSKASSERKETLQFILLHVFAEI